MSDDGQTKRGPGRPTNAERAATMSASNAIDRPVNTGNNVDIESANYVPEYDGVVDYRQLKLSLVAPQIQAVTQTEFNSIEKQEVFMQDMLVISINKSSDKMAPPLVAAGLNGDIGWFPRGVKIKMPRGIVGVLLQSQERVFNTERSQDPNADEGMVTRQSNTPCYPINILYDPRPQEGARWARRVMASGG